MAEGKHTPGEIDVFIGNANGRGLIRIEQQGTGHHIASMPRGAQSEADALEIARRWNAHDGLLEACKAMLGDVRWVSTAVHNRSECPHCGRMYDATPDDPLPDFCADDCPGEIARAAIAKATGGAE